MGTPTGAAVSLQGIPQPAELAGLPVDTEGPVFAKPWVAQVFAIVIELHRHGLFSWADWTERLSTQIALVRERGEADLGDTYYQHWLTTLELMLYDKNVMQDVEVRQYAVRWRQAYLNTPHGKPVALSSGDDKPA